MREIEFSLAKPKLDRMRALPYLVECQRLASRQGSKAKFLTPHERYSLETEAQLSEFVIQRVYLQQFPMLNRDFRDFSKILNSTEKQPSGNECSRLYPAACIAAEGLRRRSETCRIGKANRSPITPTVCCFQPGRDLEALLRDSSLKTLAFRLRTTSLLRQESKRKHDVSEPVMLRIHDAGGETPPKGG